MLGAGLLWDLGPVAITGAIIVGHVGMDRFVGFGLRHTADIKRTHLQRA